MLRRRHINADRRAHAQSLLLAAADAVRWPFERLGWLAERRVLWPLQRRFAGWGPSHSAAAVAALAALAAAAVVAGVLWPSGGNGSPERAAAPTRVAVVVPSPQAPAEKPHDPALHGAPPSFGVGKGVGVAKATGGNTGTSGSEAPASAAEASAATSLPEDSAATSSSAKPVPAGPAAMKVARRFSNAFVFYEVGERPARAKAVFGETATPELASALSERPPRLPENAKVPKARVLNLVPGPRDGKAYTVSVSLLRVGLTSELRLSLVPDESGDWKVLDVLG
ncbi:MAG TPA: hypothetical protein VLK56_09575 [Solirubrobacterales bacterium]|nr:hypothetical protein [Solirubrobacterales bacterium]